MNKHIGSTLESLFEETDERQEFELLAMKKLISARIRLAMEQKNFSNSSLARAMNSNRVQVQRLLDPQNASCSLATLASAFTVLGLKLDITTKGYPRAAPRIAAGKAARPRLAEGKSVRRARVIARASAR